MITIVVINSPGIILGSEYPKREFRAAWVATVTRLDWPYTSDPFLQQQELSLLFDRLKARGINAVIFQVRPECDAFYNSSYEPWSYWLTGSQGQAPSPYYDPLQFAVREAHARKMELHAWFNPYRAERSIGSYTLDASHVVQSHPEWILTFPAVNLKLLNPGIPQVRQHVTNVIMDVVNRYDIDGIHFDDYFYPYPSGSFTGISDEDAETFTEYSRGINDIGEWRRDNVNLLVTQIYDSINSVKPYVKFGISPFGIWKNNVPPGITGLDAYNVIYADAVTWLQLQIIDYVAPQLYWPFGGGQDYGLLLPWWASQTNSRHLYPGLAAYRVTGWDDTEMPDQLRLNRQNANVHGAIFFRANRGITDNPRGLADSLQNDFYKYPAVMPSMPWKDAVIPESPTDLVLTNSAEGTQLNWNKSPVASDGDTARFYVIYRIESGSVFESKDPQFILNIVHGNVYQYLDTSGFDELTYMYYVSALDRLHNESQLTGPVSTVSGIADAEQNLVPGTYVLEQNYPNPFNPVTTINFKTGREEPVLLAVYDIMGRCVAVLIDKKLSAGEHIVKFNAANLSSGIYFYRLQTQHFTDIKKMTVMK
jgi:uncharacterized lipoprotein YddW (UPF0748 family)